MKILVPGSFDLFHRGHLVLLQYLHKMGDVTVALGSDEYQTDYKRAPLQPYHERKAMIEQLGLVERVVRRDKVTLEGFFQTYDFDAIACGSDWADNLGKFLRLGGLTPYYLAKHDIAVIVAPNPQTSSTTRLLDMILDRAE